MSASTEPQVPKVPIRQRTVGGHLTEMKKLIICCDGTWEDSNQGLKNAPDAAVEPKDPVLSQPTNVTRILRCVTPTDSHNHNQITYYQSGIGTINWLDKVAGGATGLGLSEHIREAYHFIAQNYNKDAGDEIYLIGFSRGSFTARSIASFISDVGLLTPKGMMSFYPIFQDWENQLKPLKDWTPSKDLPWPAPRPSLYSNADAYVQKLVDLGLTTPGVVINAVAVYDTVGSLGLPRLGIFSKDHVHRSLDYAFVDSAVPKYVRHAIHAVALDERRECFSPTLWELPDPQPGQTLTQVWFSGSHADVGGSYDDTRAADITLAWMLNQLSPYIDFDANLLKMQYMTPPATEKPARGWANGTLHDEFKGFYVLAGLEGTRTPLEYNVYDHMTGNEVKPLTPLTATNERIHASVRLRMGLPGKGLDDKGVYNPPSLHGWKVTGTNTGTDEPNDAAITQAAVPGKGGVEGRFALKSIQEAQKQIVWVKGGKKLAEEPMSLYEWELLRSFMPSIEGKFLSITPRPTPVADLLHKVEGKVEGKIEGLLHSHHH